MKLVVISGSSEGGEAIREVEVMVVGARREVKGQRGSGSSEQTGGV